jgi:hypothetical protein
MYWMLGPLTVTGTCTGTTGGTCPPVGVAAVRPGGFGSVSPLFDWFAGSGKQPLGGGSGGLGGGLWRRLAEAEGGALPAGTHDNSAPRSLAPDAPPSATHALRARRHRQLQLLGRLDNTTGDAFDDAVDWTAPPADAYVGIEPFPSYLHSAFIGDLVASDPAYLQSARLGTFAPLWNATAVDALVAPFLLTNASDYDPLLARGGGRRFGGLPFPLTGLFPDAGDAQPPLYSYGAGAGQNDSGLWTLSHWHDGNHTANNNHSHNASCFVPLDAAAFSYRDLRFFEPAQLAFSFEPLDGRGWGAHAGGGGWRARRRLDRTLWATGDQRDPALVVTGIDAAGCVRVDPDNWAQVLADDASGRADIETCVGGGKHRGGGGQGGWLEADTTPDLRLLSRCAYPCCPSHLLSHAQPQRAAAEDRPAGAAAVGAAGAAGGADTAVPVLTTGGGAAAAGVALPVHAGDARLAGAAAAGTAAGAPASAAGGRLRRIW